MKARLVVSGLWISLLWLFAIVARATTIHVTSDSGDRDVGAACVLRDAITYANTFQPTGGCGAPSATGPATPEYNPGTIIELPPGVTITLAAVDDFDRNTALPPITQPVTITGNASTIRRSFDLPCLVDGAPAPGEFGLLYNESRLTLENLVLENGCADGIGGTSGDGGAVYNAGQLLLNHVVLRGNHASTSGGAVASVGYAAGFGQLTVTDSLFVGNAAARGGGIALTGPSATLSMVRSSLELNEADLNFGGGAMQLGPATNADLVNVSLLQNSAGSGSAIESDGSLRLSFVTIAGNLTLSGSGGALQDGASGPVDVLKVRNSIVANNEGGVGNCQFGAGAVLSDVATLSSDASCAGFAMQEVDPGLVEPPPSDGATRRVYALAPASPAVDAATDCTDFAGSAVTEDQRFAPRPSLASCDAGAFELGEAIFGSNFEVITF